jgi:hypothetical protein
MAAWSATRAYRFLLTRFSSFNKWSSGTVRDTSEYAPSVNKACAELAERDFREAIELARKMGAKSPELRATTSLARLLRDTNRRDEAHAMLSEIYNWFTEGFETDDLKGRQGAARRAEQFTMIAFRFGSKLLIGSSLTEVASHRPSCLPLGGFRALTASFA